MGSVVGSLMYYCVFITGYRNTLLLIDYDALVDCICPTAKLCNILEADPTRAWAGQMESRIRKAHEPQSPAYVCNDSGEYA